MVVAFAASAWGTRHWIPRLSAAEPKTSPGLRAVVGEVRQAFVHRSFRAVLGASVSRHVAWGMADTLGIFMATFFWRRATVAGGVWSIASGMGVTVAWEVAKKIIGHHPYDLPAVYPALVVSILVLVLVSLAGSPPPREKWERFATARSE